MSKNLSSVAVTQFDTEVKHAYQSLSASLSKTTTERKGVTGKTYEFRKMGKLSFLKIRDIEADLQVSIKIDLVGEEKYNFFKTNTNNLSRPIHDHVQRH